MMEVRKNHERGHANHGWLDSYHSFSFADYYDPQYMGFGPLRVINEDRIAPATGFGMHGHRNMEIITYMLQGELAHKDSMGNGSVIRAGDVQRMSAGKGVMHSEFSHTHEEQTHLLQIWIEPNVFGISPEYEEKHFDAAEKRGRLRVIASPDGKQGALVIHQDARIYAGMFDGAETARLSIPSGHRAYVHVARGQLMVNGVLLQAGDALKVEDEPHIELSQGQEAEVLVFEMV